jgi:hypothetical protein
MPTKRPKPAATETHGDFDKFTNFVRRLMAVPHSEVKAAMEADKTKRRGAPVSRDPDASSKER